MSKFELQKTLKEQSGTMHNFLQFEMHLTFVLL